MEYVNSSKKMKLDHEAERNDILQAGGKEIKGRSIPASENGESDNEKFEKFVDEEYFSSYADTEVHRTMIEDQVRTDAYHKAIMQDPGFIKGKVVCDVGCGSGILSLFCAQAGAKKVYAIDASKIAMLAKKTVKNNGFEDIITGFLKGCN